MGETLYSSFFHIESSEHGLWLDQTVFQHPPQLEALGVAGPPRLCEEGWSTGLLTGGTLGRLDSRAPETCPEADLSPPAWESQTLRPSAHMEGLQISLEPPRGTGPGSLWKLAAHGGWSRAEEGDSQQKAFLPIAASQPRSLIISGGREQGQTHTVAVTSCPLLCNVGKGATRTTTWPRAAL